MRIPPLRRGLKVKRSFSDLGIPIPLSDSPLKREEQTKT